MLPKSLPSLSHPVFFFFWGGGGGVFGFRFLVLGFGLGFLRFGVWFVLGGVRCEGRRKGLGNRFCVFAF